MFDEIDYDCYIQDAIEMVSAWEFETEEQYFSALRDQVHLMAGLDAYYGEPPETQLAFTYC